jgi:type I restriction enzyme S subunit
MTATLAAYPTYKDSGVPWLGKVPVHWQVQRLKSLVNNVLEQSEEARPSDVYIALEHVEGWTGRLRRTGEQVVFESQVKRFGPGDVLFGKLRPYLGKVTRPRCSGVCVSEFFVLRPRSHVVLPDYLEHLLRSKPIIEIVNSSTFGAKMPRAEWQFLGGVELPFPPPAEQVAIVRFLEDFARRARQYLAAKRKLLGLLNEQRHARAYGIVTRGLDPNVPLKASGVEWLGEVPAHWEVRRAKYLFREVDSRTATGAETLLSLRMHRGLVAHKDVSRTPIPAEALIGFKKVVPGQLVMNRMRAAIGMFGVVSEPGLVSPDYAVLDPADSVHPDYFLRVFQTPSAGAAFRVESRGLGTGSSGFLRLYMDRFGTIKFALPPYEEQEAIVRRIATETAGIDIAEDRLSREIQLLEEYHTRLIADAVTGKIDLREAAEGLSTEPTEEEPPRTDVFEEPEEEEANRLDLEVAAGEVAR